MANHTRGYKHRTVKLEGCHHVNRKAAQVNPFLCTGCYSTKWHNSTPERRARKLSRMSAQNSERSLVRKYGMTLADRAKMSAAQGDVCAICGNAQKQLVTWRTDDAITYRGLVIDHSHNTGRIRGMLCTVCNVSIAAFDRHGAGWAQKALDYLGMGQHATFAVGGEECQGL